VSRFLPGSPDLTYTELTSGHSKSKSTALRLPKPTMLLGYTTSGRGLLRASRPRVPVCRVLAVAASRPDISCLFHSGQSPLRSRVSKSTKGGSLSRSDRGIEVEHPSEREVPSRAPVEGAGRAGSRTLPTLASYSLAGKVGIVTGGARGLGLVMGQGMVISGASLAIVDMNGMLTRQTSLCGARWTDHGTC
jgi:hypothetical protein